MTTTANKVNELNEAAAGDRAAEADALSSGRVR